MIVLLGVRIVNIFIFIVIWSMFKVNLCLWVMCKFVWIIMLIFFIFNFEGVYIFMGIFRNYGCYDIKRDLFV